MAGAGRISIIALCVFALTGCSILASSIDPNHVPLGDYDMKPIKTPNPVALINANEDRVTKVSGDGWSYDTNLKDWTEQAVVLIKQWFTQYDVPVVPGAEKQLTLEIVKVRHLPVTFGKRTCLELVVKTGNGDVKVFPAEGGAGGIDRSAGYAINYAVARLVKDGTIAKYIAE